MQKKVIALEPFTKNFQSAQINITKNNLNEKIKILQAGCSGKKGYMTINENTTCPRSHLHKEKMEKKSN